MRAIARRAALVAIAGSLFGLTDCQHPSTLQPANAGAAAGLAPGVAAHATHLRLAALVPKSPVTLTSSDGKGLALTSLSAHAVLVGPLAFTEMRLVFANPEPRTLEGTFAITMPRRASISRFAMRIGNSWQEGEVVEKQRAREAFEDFLHRKRDPALLEQAAGNQFSARVFPIPAGGTKEIVVSYAQELDGSEPYVLPMRGLPEVGVVDVGATAEGANLSLATRHREKWAPDEDFVVDRSKLPTAEGLRSGDLVLARVHPTVDTRPDPIRSAIVLVDTSASMALEIDERSRQLGAIVERIAASPPEATLTVACFDQEVVESYSGPARSFGTAQVDAIRARTALGASDLGRALRWARDRARAAGAARVMVLSDGVATAGSTDRAELVAAARALGDAGVERLDAIATGGIRDDGVLAALAKAGLAHDGIVVDAGADPEQVAHRLGHATRSGIGVKVEGASWWHPRTIDGAQPGDESLVYAQVPPGTSVSIAVDGSPVERPELRSVERPLLERAWTQARIASLLEREGKEGDAEAARKEVIALSTSHRVLSPYTAMLVLETEGDYARFHLDRTGLADVLEIQGSRVALTHRKGAVLPPWLPPAAPPKIARQVPPERPEPRGGHEQPDRQDTREAAQFGVIGLLGQGQGTPPAPQADATGHMFLQTAPGDPMYSGGLGLSGAGEGGGGRGEGIGMGNAGSVGHGAGVGHGRLGGSHAARPPSVRMGATSVSGRLPPEVIQRIVRQNFGRFRACYHDALRSRPTEQGRVTIRFVIDRTGRVASAGDGGSDIGDPSLVACVARAFENLGFPQPDGSVVTVVYPIHFSPEGGASAPPPADAPTVAADTPVPSPAPPRLPVEPPPAEGEPYSGRFADVMRAIATRDAKHALELAWAWRDEDAGDVLALVALGEALEASDDRATAARAYGSIIDLFPSSADMRRMAGERLERLHSDPAADLAADDYTKTVVDRPDHPSSHRLLAYALLKKRDYAAAFDAAVAGLAYRYPDGRFLSIDRILRDDVGLIGAAWAAAEPAKRDSILARVRTVGGTVQDTPSLRFVLSWESDANDVDLHVRDADGNHAFFQAPRLPSGGELYADVTTGYGPECFAVPGAREKRSSRYSLQVHYYSRGPMGYGMGKVEIVEHDGHGALKFDERPFLVMNDRAYVELGDY
jgi:hypothetical protein